MHHYRDNTNQVVLKDILLERQISLNALTPCHCSEIFITTAVTSLKQESSLANILATFIRCLTL
jgi:hypothetical protein